MKTPQVMLTNMKNYLEWLGSAELTRSVGDHIAINDEQFVGDPGLVFGDGSYILLQDVPEGYRFWTVAGTEEIATDSLMDAVDFLWHNHSQSNFQE